MLDEGQCVSRCSNDKKVAPLDLTEELQDPTVSTRLVGGRNHMEGRLEVIFSFPQFLASFLGSKVN